MTELMAALLVMFRKETTHHKQIVSNRLKQELQGFHNANHSSWMKETTKKPIRSLGSITIATLTATLRPCLTCTKLKCTVNTHHFQLAILHRLPSAAARSATAGHLVAVPNVQVRFQPKLGTAGGF